MILESTSVAATDIVAPRYISSMRMNRTGWEDDVAAMWSEALLGPIRKSVP